MKNIAVAALLVLLTFGMNAQIIYQDDRDSYRSNLNATAKYRKHIADGHITEAKIYAYPHKHPNGILRSTNKYDIHGNILEDIRYKKNGRMKSDFRYQYNDSNLMTSSIELTKKGKAKSGEFWTYDKSGNNIQSRYCWKDTGNATSTWVMTYDSKNNPTQIKSYSSKMKLHSTSVYEYYDDGSKKKTTTFNKNEKVTAIWNYDCNPIGKLQESKMKDTSKICVHYETDKNGNPIKVREIYTQSHGLFKHRLRNIIKYDKDNHFIELITMKMNGRETWHSSAEFNTKGNQTEWRKYIPNTTRIKRRLVYTYNNSGDVMEATIYSKSSDKGSVLKYVYN